MDGNTNGNGPRHDWTGIGEFLLHAAVELERQQLDLGGRPVPDDLEWAIRYYRSKYSLLLPDAGSLGFLAQDTAGDGDAQRNAARQALTRLRGRQGKAVMGVLELLVELRGDAPDQWASVGGS